MRLTHPSLALAACLLSAAVVLPGCSGSGGGPEGAGEGTTGGSTPATESSPGTTTTEGKALVLDRCTRCHDVTRIKQASKDEDEWRSTVARMRENGAQVDDEEAETIVGFLASGGAEQL